MADLRVSQALTLVEADAQQVQISQALTLVEADLVQVRVSQALTLVEAEYVAPIEQGAADYAGATGAAASAAGGAATTTPSATAPSAVTGAAAGVGGGAATTTPAASTPQSATGAAASAAGGAATTTPAATAPQTATGAAAGVAGGAATTTPSAATPSNATGRAANARGSAPTTTPSATSPQTMMRRAGNIQIDADKPAAQSSQSAAAPLPSAITGASSADGKFSAELFDRAGARVRPVELTLQPAQYSAQAIGGPDQAVVLVSGVLPPLWTALGWLAYTVRIKNPLGRVVWEGIVEDVSLTLPALRVGLSIRDLVNRVQVHYTRTLDTEAATESLVTAWAQNAASIARYGTKELKASLNDGSLAQAEALRDTILESSYKPLQTVSIGGGNEPGAELRCIGRWLTLDWTYYAYDAGYVTYEPEQTTEQAIGYSYTGTGIGFKDENIHDIDMGLSTMPERGLIVISGITVNAGTVTIDGVPATDIADQASVTSAGISFAASDDIVGTLEDWTVFTPGEMIEVAGSASNDGFYWVKKIVAGNRMEISGGTIVGEGGGPSKTITQGHHASATDIVFVKDDPGPAITLASHAQIAQRFQAPATWAAQDIVLLLARTGAPVDNLVVGLYSEAAGVPDALLGAATLAAVDVPDSLAWTETSLATPVTVTSGAYYWIVVSRDGAADDTAYWRVGVSDELVSTFVAKLWTGAAWIDHPGAVDMALQVWATIDSADKAGAVATGADYVARVAVIEASGVRVRSFSDGTRRRSEEMQALLDAGDDDAARLLAWFDASGALNVGVQEADDGALAIQQDGRLVALPQQEWEAGALPVRRWVRIMDLPPGEIFEQMSPFYVEAAAYDASAMSLALEPLANRNAWEGSL